jgi:hypothetical protein
MTSQSWEGFGRCEVLQVEISRQFLPATLQNPLPHTSYVTFELHIPPSLTVSTSRSRFKRPIPTLMKSKSKLCEEKEKLFCPFFSVLHSTNESRVSESEKKGKHFHSHIV